MGSSTGASAVWALGIPLDPAKPPLVVLARLAETGKPVWFSILESSQALGRADVAVAPGGAVYVAGTFNGVVDFDPTPQGQHVRENSSSSPAIFLSRWDSDGTWRWTRTWPAINLADGVSVATASDDSVWIRGHCYPQNPVDFDPGDGKDEQPCNGPFVIRLGSDGKYGAILRPVMSQYMAVLPDGAVIVAGTFASPTDFDPGPAEDRHTPAIIPQVGYGHSAYVTRFSAQGQYQWTRTHGGKARESIFDMKATTDGVVVTGNFTGTVDFDPGAGVVERTAPDSDATIFLSKLTATAPSPGRMPSMGRWCATPVATWWRCSRHREPAGRVYGGLPAAVIEGQWVQGPYLWTVALAEPLALAAAHHGEARVIAGDRDHLEAAAGGPGCWDVGPAAGR